MYKNITGLKKLKIKIIKRRKKQKQTNKNRRRNEKGKLHRTAKAQWRGRGI